MKHRVEGHQNLYKDLDTGVIVNRESTERQKYRLAKQQARQVLETQDEISDLKEEIKELSSLKEEMDEIKTLLKQLLNK
ncbi:hypothetical protein [Synechococcus phage S-B68]|nr:hypothetical protein [Synechococcus phage S-B68]